MRRGRERSARGHKVQIEETVATRSGRCIKLREQMTTVALRFSELGTVIIE